MNGLPLITILTAVPLIGAFGVLGLGAKSKALARGLALTIAFIALAMTLLLWHRFNAASGQLQFEEMHAWIPAIGVQYHLGIDGLGLVMLLLSAIVVPMSIAASWQIQEGTSLYFSLVLFLQAGLFGTFSALNFFHWFIFWELSLIPAFFLVRLWGGPQRAAAATQFFVYTMVGSLALLLAFLGIFLATKNGPSPGIFDFTTLADLGRNDAIMAGAVTNRDLLLFVTLFTYSSINHLGYCLLAIFAVATSGASLAAPATEKAAALSGVFLQMFNHGLTAATLFWFIALLEQRSGGLRGLNDFGGIRKVAPVL